ncbi:Ovochymase-2 [Bagarius yarrelli]|uniref:Ovochymase-2 n=1 Tax=Bagarius yarrelli TaxID=175774 RepID=A0A556V0Q8_BAGYA|nr:Ovochymase-2 [Bagarius yarrelli]
MAPLPLWIFTVLLCLLCHSCAALSGVKCGSSKLRGTLHRYLRIVGGSQGLYGSHPWLVSLRFRESHFCGASILTDRWLLSAAHCFSTSTQAFLRGVEAVVGDYDQRVVDRWEQRFDDFAQPVCLPLPGEIFLPKTPCVVAGWGLMKERGQMASVLQEVQLDLVDPAICRHVLQTIRPELQNLTVLCAGPDRGGKDACQGDSGGPLLCPRTDGQWVLVGITSWGKGCGRGWINNWMKPLTRRSSPAVFTNLPMFIKWLRWKGLNYSNNDREHSWSISVPGSKRILLEFFRFDLENHPWCQSDHLTVFAGEGLPIGRFCGSRSPAPLLIHSNTATLQFMSDFSISGLGFSVHFRAVENDYTLGPSCGTVALFQPPAALQSPDYPQSYGDDIHCRWVIYVPEGYVVKLDFTDFVLEESKECQYDSLSVFGDFEAKEQIDLQQEEHKDLDEEENHDNDFDFR